ncbi:IS1249 family transposase [Leucobacter insecticola]|uniref:IS1249 family transposase n=1 Tax=Leucobacter insecticola TaxID=2714934 RepID=A0A6G8FGJ6_9MICO|nr:IS1249 family transposase [Leucobacter insecticola]QIM15521.1 IS1249 family transposase [Leucobacter insecticola]
MPKPSNTTSCLLCTIKLVKNGKTAAGTQRWKCPSCGASTSRKRDDVTRKHQLDRFFTWLLGKHSQPEITGTQTGRSFRRKAAWCWRITPRLPTVTLPPKYVIIDGTYIGSWCLLIATEEHQIPLAWQWCSTESQAAWEALLRQIPAPLVVICDGGSGVRAAIREQWPDTLTQRCLFHIWMNLRTHLTLRPRTPAGQALLELGKRLRRVTNTDDAVAWLQQLNDWHSIYGHLTTERSYAKKRLPGGLWDSPTGKKWWYTHDRLRKAYNLLAELQRRGHLFTYLTAGGPKTTSRLEGGINALIKQTLRLHRGMTIDHQKRAAEWVLVERAGLLHTAPAMITEAAIAPPQKQRPRFTEPDPGPALYDTALSSEEGLWLRTGWGGRH